MIVEITAEAEADLEAIGDYIARDNPARAVSFVRELGRSCMDMADFPEAWPVIPRYETQDIRRRVQGRYLIFYQIRRDKATVLHVLSGAMDVDAVLFPQG